MNWKIWLNRFCVVIGAVHVYLLLVATGVIAQVMEVEPMQLDELAWAIPLCDNCIPGTIIPKEKSHLDPQRCPNERTPYLEYIGTCQRFQCSNGHYYRWSGWRPTVCFNRNLSSDGTCPGASCSPAE